MLRLTRYLVLVACCLTALSLFATPLLKAGDRVVFLGDSITQQRMYTRYITQYWYCRYPDIPVTFFNAGWDNDAASSGLARVERDVLALHPTVVTLYYGMNDGRYTGVDSAFTRLYHDGMEGLIKTLQAHGVRVIVFTPGCSDPDNWPRLAECKYNSTLEGLAKVALELAAQYGCPGIDVFHPMLAYQQAQKAANPKFTMIPDSRHPDVNGHLVIAQIMLCGLGAEPMPPLGAVDLTAKTAFGLRVVSQAPYQLLLETTAPALTPFWYDANAEMTMQTSGFQALAEPSLTVRGLPAAAYDVAVDDAYVARLTAAHLAAGVPLPGSYSLDGRIVHDLVQCKENAYFSAWRDIRLPFAVTPAVVPVVEALLMAQERFHTALCALTRPHAKAVITLTPVPEGPNLALKKPCVCSDPNAPPWNVGLTDGSWVADANHCFATGGTPTLPKTVAIDLETPARISTVVAGTPAFGSQRTIIVSVSIDGTTYTEVGRHVFPLGKETRCVYAFPAVDARYVRLTYPDHYADTITYPVEYAFTNEVEVYGPNK